MTRYIIPATCPKCGCNRIRIEYGSDYVNLYCNGKLEDHFRITLPRRVLCDNGSCNYKFEEGQNE